MSDTIEALQAENQRLKDRLLERSEQLNDALLGRDNKRDALEQIERRKMEKKINEILTELKSPELLHGPICEHNLNVILVRLQQR
jgi:uncharacterized protein YdcH (DUF465 family)